MWSVNSLYCLALGIITNYSYKLIISNKFRVYKKISKIKMMLVRKVQNLTENIANFGGESLLSGQSIAMQPQGSEFIYRILCNLISRSNVIHFHCDTLRKVKMSSKKLFFNIIEDKTRNADQ